MQVKLTPLSPDKSSMDGQWKKKKGPAPPRPIPPKRQVKKLPRKAVNNELLEIGKKKFRQIDLSAAVLPVVVGIKPNHIRYRNIFGSKSGRPFLSN